MRLFLLHRLHLLQLMIIINISTSWWQLTMSIVTFCISKLHHFWIRRIWRTAHHRCQILLVKRQLYRLKLQSHLFRNLLLAYNIDAYSIVCSAIQSLFQITYMYKFLSRSCICVNRHVYSNFFFFKCIGVT